MATAQLNGLGGKVAKAFAEWLSEEGPKAIWMTCASCRHSQRKGPMFCGKYNIVPPVAIIVDATKCEGYDDESEIPF